MTLEKTLIRRMVLLGAFAVITSVAVAENPSPAIVITSRGKMGGNEHGVLIVDPLAMKVVASVPTTGGSIPQQVAVSADGKLAFVTNTTLGRPDARNFTGIIEEFITVIDLAARKELRRVQTGPDSYPHGIVVAGGKVFFTAEGSRIIGRYDPASNQIDSIYGTGQRRMKMMVITKDTKKIFTTNTESNSVTAIEPGGPPAGYKDPASSVKSFEEISNIAGSGIEARTPFAPWKQTLIPVGKYPEALDMSPDEKEVWVATRADGGVTIIDIATKKVSHTLKLQGATPFRLKFTPDGKRVIIASHDSGELRVIDAVTRKEIKRIDVGDAGGDLIMARDGSCAYANGENNYSIAVIDLKTLELKGRISTGDGIQTEGMAWAETR